MTLALAIVARRRPWWRRLADAVLGIDRRALAPDQEHSDRLLIAEYNRIAPAPLPGWHLSVPEGGAAWREWNRDRMRAEIAYHHALIAWRARNDGRPAPLPIPSDGMPCSR